MPPPSLLLRSFRNCQVAAPLKHLDVVQFILCRRSFRNCQVAAPLKLGTAAGGANAAGTLPQLSSCGPIEASLRRQGGKLARNAFRNCQVAAPLKHAVHRRHVRRRRTFRNCQVAAPLKQYGGRTARSIVAAFRNCQVAAPLKRAARHGRVGPAPQPSATVKLRPH